MECHAFTSYCEGLTNTLKNEVTVESDNYTVRVTALWDTGATNSCVSHEVAEALHLIPFGQCEVRTPSGSAIKDTYCANIILPNDVAFKDIIVMDSEIGGQEIGVLVGMDIISQGDFAVSNFSEKTIFTFRHPSQGAIDFVKSIRTQQLIGPPHGRGRRRGKRK